MTPDALADLHARCFTTPRPWSEAEFKSLLSAPGVFLISDDHSFVMGRVIADEAELLTIAVDPLIRRQGRGQARLSDFQARARALGATTAFLEVAADNTPAIGLYRRAGYTESGRRKGYYRGPNGDRVDALVLCKSLT